MMNFQADTTVS